MRRFFYLLALAAAVAGCSEESTSLDIYHQKTIDFEGEEWSQAIATNSSSFDFMTAEYVWSDDDTTLSSRPKFTTSEWGSFYGGGCTVSNYGSGDLAARGSYGYDLYVYKEGVADSRTGCGAGGSDNFLVLYGNMESLTAVVDADCRPEIYFRDGKPRKIERCKVTATTYFVNIAENGNEFSPKLSPEDEPITLYATGVDSYGNPTATAEFTLASYGSVVKSWTSWDLSSLGEVVKVQFNILGGHRDEYGMTIPKYFALDDIEVKWQE